MNILIIGKPFRKLIELINNSNLDCKIFTAGDFEMKNFPNIEYKNFDELIEKARLIKIDIALNIEKPAVKNGVFEAFQNSKINLISVNKKWLNLETSPHAAKQLLNHYSINTPKIIKTPLDFPINVVNETWNNETVVYSLSELTNMLEHTDGRIYYEEPTEGELIKLLALWDGKNILYLTPNPENEVKSDRLELLKTKLNFMLSDEHADFRGFFTVNLVWYKNDWYVKNFVMNIDEKTNIKNIDKDFVFILNAAIYQKLNEI